MGYSHLFLLSTHFSAQAFFKPCWIKHSKFWHFWLLCFSSFALVLSFFFFLFLLSSEFWFIEKDEYFHAHQGESCVFIKRQIYQMHLLLCNHIFAYLFPSPSPFSVIYLNLEPFKFAVRVKTPYKSFGKCQAWACQCFAFRISKAH